MAFVINGDPSTRQARGQALGKEKLAGRRRDTRALTPIRPTPGEKRTHYCHGGRSDENVLDMTSFLIIHADVRSHSEFSPERTGHISSVYWNFLK